MSQDSRCVHSSRPRLRIILAPSAYYPHVGGIEELTRQLALTFDSRGHDVSVLTNRWPEGVERHETLDGVQVTRLRFPLPAANVGSAARFVAAAPSSAAALLRYVRRQRPDVLHVIGAGPQAMYIGALSRWLGTRIVFTAQGELTFDPREVFRHSVILRVGLRRVVQVADAVTACSTYVADELVKVAAPRNAPVIIPNGVDPIEFASVTRSEDPTSILSVGRLVPQKGFDIVIRAFAQAKLQNRKLVIAGAGPERDSLIDLTRALQIDERVEFVGAADRTLLSKLLANARIFVLASRAEPFGIALLEAMAAGVPVVATDAGGVVDFAHDRENALLVAVDDPHALRNAMEELDHDESLQARLSSSGRDTADGLSWREISLRYERLYA